MTKLNFRNGAKHFAPKETKTEVKFSGNFPEILISDQAYDDIYTIVDIADKEVAWLGTVKQEENKFIIEEIFLFKQKASHAFCELDAGDISDWGTRLVLEREDAMEVLNNLKFWGHSHVNMGVFPSHQDDMQMKEFQKTDFFIRGIFNKKGEIKFDLYLNQMGIEIHDVPWRRMTVVNSETREKWEKEISEKVTQDYYYQYMRYRENNSFLKNEKNNFLKQEDWRRQW